MPTLTETQRRNEVAAEFAAKKREADNLISQLVAAKDNILLLAAEVGSEDQFDAADVAELQAVVAGLAARVRTEVLGE